MKAEDVAVREAVQAWAAANEFGGPNHVLGEVALVLHWDAIDEDEPDVYSIGSVPRLFPAHALTGLLHQALGIIRCHHEGHEG